jgi:hypothetical protein
VIVSDPIKPQPPGPEPLSVRLIHAARDWCADHLMIVIAAVVGVVLAAWLVTGIYTVPNGSSPPSSVSVGWLTMPYRRACTSVCLGASTGSPGSRPGMSSGRDRRRPHTLPVTVDR